MAAKTIPAFCPLCRSRCGVRATVEDDRLLAIDPDPSHPTGAALCAKGKASPALVDHPERLRHPMRRTRPKGDPDPGWERISWDEALDAIAAAMLRIKAESGAEAVAFAASTPSATALSDTIPWIERLINAFGSPNNCYATEICNWHKDFARVFTDGAGVATPDLENAGCILYWGYNPSTAWLAQAGEAAAAVRRGAKVVVVDPRKVALAVKADAWLRVRPGTDGALALSIAGEMIARGWFDRDFVHDWTTGPLLVRDDTGRFLRDDEGRHVAWDPRRGEAVVYDATARRYGRDGGRFALFGEVVVRGVACRPAFALYAALCAEHPPERAEAETGVPAERIVTAARLLWEHRPVAYYGWSGVGQHTNATQTDRALALLYALTGSIDAPGGNVTFAKVPVRDISAPELLPAAQRAKALGLAERPLGPPKDGWITSDDLYRAILDETPYRVRGLVAFGGNLAVGHADSGRARAALERLEFYAQVDLFMSPTNAFADIVLPAASGWEREGLRAGFEINQAAQELVQLRPALVSPRGEARADTRIVFDLACRLGLGAHFWNGDVDAGEDYRLGPSGITVAKLREHPEGVRVPLNTEHRKYRQNGFATRTGKIEVFSEALQEIGQDPLPRYVPPAVLPTRRFPLALTCSKSPQFCHSQHRNIAALRRHVPHPVVEIHPDAAASRGIAERDWVAIETPSGRVRARAKLQAQLDPGVVAAQHGWWQGCAELGLPAYDPFSDAGANYNLLIGNAAIDPISGSVPHRSYACEVTKL
jgi:anaerobic selenocysteine-containing dehydrogenase